ncbi:FAD-binding protein [bacterium]|nr:FAD-binding protein [bacterium]
MISERVITSLRKILGEDSFIISPDDMEKYSCDETPEISAFPDAVALPKNPSQVEKIVSLCYEFSVPITPRGAGTGVVGGALPVGGGIVLSLERMDKIVDVDRKNLVAVVQPGVITGEIQRTVEAEGLFYPPDPASVDSCSIGGNVATCAGGMKAFKYGVTRNFVLGLDVVFPPGVSVKLRGKMIKNVAGYDLMNLFIGSEGTLGIATEITLRLFPKPKFSFDLLAGFSSVYDAVRSTLSIIPKTRVMPAAMEFMQGEIAPMVSRYLGRKVPFVDAGAQILVSLEGSDRKKLEEELMMVGEHLLDAGAIDVLAATSKFDSEKLWKARRSIRDAIRDISPDISAQDVSVPPSKIPELMQKIAKISDEENVKIVGFGHLGDGNMHIDLLREDMEDDIWCTKKEKTELKILSAAVELGGSITGEHGIGFIKRKYLDMAIGGENIRIMRAVKDAIDPKGLMNPHKIFP